MDPNSAKSWTQLLADNPLAIIVVIFAFVIYSLARYIVKLTNDRIEREKEISQLLVNHADKFRESIDAIKGLVRRNSNES